MAGRKAADPGIVEAIGSFLADNALTRSWRETMDRHVISPVERMYVSDEDLTDGVRTMVRDAMPDDGKLSDRQIQALGILKGDGFNREVDEPKMREWIENAVNPGLEADSAAASVMKAYDTSREAKLRASELFIDGRVGLTEAGNNMRQFGLGSPVAAYSAVTAGGAMGTAAAMEAYDWWMAQQQQAQKDAQLPLQGSAVTG